MLVLLNGRLLYVGSIWNQDFRYIVLFVTPFLFPVSVCCFLWLVSSVWVYILSYWIFLMTVQIQFCYHFSCTCNISMISGLWHSFTALWEKHVNVLLSFFFCHGSMTDFAIIFFQMSPGLNYREATRGRNIDWILEFLCHM